MNMNDVVLDSNQASNINYVRARMAIEETAKSRRELRDSKMVVIEHLGGAIKHPSAIELRKGATKQVVFNDGTKARF
jgi:hypothetical protein